MRSARVQMPGVDGYAVSLDCRVPATVENQMFRNGTFAQ